MNQSRMAILVTLPTIRFPSGTGVCHNHFTTFIIPTFLYEPTAVYRYSLAYIVITRIAPYSSLSKAFSISPLLSRPQDDRYEYLQNIYRYTPLSPTLTIDDYTQGHTTYYTRRKRPDTKQYISSATMVFGDFSWICAQSSLPVCSILGPPTTLTTTHQPLLLTTCVARSIELANTIIFQAATDFAHIGALIMTTIMILHVRSKFTAVGRKEILTFFYIYLVLTCVSLVLDAGVLHATGTGPFLYFVAIQNGLTSALCTSLLVNGFVGFQLYEDGTTLSVWLLRASATGMFTISFLVSLVTFKGWAGMGPENTTGLFVVLYVLNALFIFVYLVMQIMLVVNTLQDRWPLGDLFFGAVFFVIGQVLLYALGTTICEQTSHYLDPVFFATVLNLLAVMMVYKVCFLAYFSL